MKLAVVGAGGIGKLRARSVAGNPQTQLVAVADVDEAAARAAAGREARGIGDWKELLGTDVDALILSTPVQFHHEMVVEALRAGKHVLCEKPLSNSLESCLEILEVARASGRTLAVGFNHRYYPAIKFLKQHLDRGSIGRLDLVRVFGGHDGLHNFRADWQYKGAISGGGAMMDVGIHMTDLARYVVGEITEVYGHSAGNVWNVEQSEDRAVAIFRSATGVPVSYEATWNEWKGYRFYVEAYGDRGMVRGYYAPMSNLLIQQERPGAPRRKTVKRYPEIAVREKLRGWTTTALITFQEELRDFLAMVEGRPVALADGWSGMRAIEIAHAVNESTRTGKVVHLRERPSA